MIAYRNKYYPYGSLFGESAAASLSNQRLFGGKELVRDMGFNCYDQEARCYDPVLGRFLSQDPLQSQYFPLSSYLYCAANPVMLSDPTGMTIKVQKEYQDKFLECLKNVFPNSIDSFSFNDDGKLSFNGNEKEFSRAQKAIFKGLSYVMKDETTTNFYFAECVNVTSDDGQICTLNANREGGAFALIAKENDKIKFSENHIVIGSSEDNLNVLRVTDVFYIKPIDPKNGDRFVHDEVETNITDKLFHEIGHIHCAGQSQDKVIDYNNKVRKILKLKERPYDERHNCDEL